MEQHPQADGGLGSAFSAAVPDVADPTVDPASAESLDGFVNEPLDVTGLPLLESEEFESLHPNYLRVRLIGDAIFAGIVIIGAAVAAFLATWWWLPLIIGGVLLALTALAAWLQTIEVGHIGYLVREKDFSFRSGVINRNVTTVPFARVQHVSIDRGPLARAFGLATLAMRTAGDGLTVPGMGEEVAAKLKALVVDRAGALADAEYSDGDLAPVTALPQEQPAGDWVPPTAEHD
ncbi:MAG: PH domain-containing protein [Acidimicrobiales bacterium]